MIFYIQGGVSVSLNYANIDFESLVTQLKEKIRQKDSWKDTVDASTGTTFIELFAYIANLLMFYLQRTFEEHYVDIAQYRESLIRLGKLVGYKVRRPKGSEGIVRFTPINPLQSPVQIPKGTEVYTNNNIVFYTTDTVVIYPQDEYIDINIRQGIRRTQEFISNGKSFQEFKFGSPNTSDIDITVMAGESQLNIVSSLATVEGTGYIGLFTDLDNRQVLCLGTPLIGGVPIQGTPITVTYYDTIGLDSNIFSQISWTTELNGFRVDSVSSSMSGGDGDETVEELRMNIPAVFATGDRCVTKSDFKAIVKSIAGVDKVYVREVKDNLDVPFKTISIYVKPVGSFELDSSFKAYIEGILNSRNMIGIDYNVTSPLVRSVSVLVRVKVKAGYNTGVVRGKCGIVLSELYSTADFGEWIEIGEITTSLNSLSEVDSTIVILPNQDIALKPWELIKVGNIVVEAV